MNQRMQGSAVLAVDSYLREGTADLGPLVVRDDIHSGIGPFRTFPEYHTTYPEVVVKALLELYLEYNANFAPLVEANREFDTDYQYCFAADGTPLNRWVQIDMVGLPRRFLEVASAFSVSDVKAALRHSIFEIENSLAMYQLLERVAPRTGFREAFRASLDELRRRYGKPIAILAVTDAKYRALLSDELGVSSPEEATDALVLERTGFDAILDPSRFRAHLAANGGDCAYLLYVRSSDPVAKLRKPGEAIDHPLLSDPGVRRTIKANSLTFNVDDPAEQDPAKRINDTKAYMPPMQMAYPIADEAELFSPECYAHLRSGRPLEQFLGERLNSDFIDYLQRSGIDPLSIAMGERMLRAKPMQGTYGCYGHHTLSLAGKAKKRQALRTDLRQRGRYVVQAEMSTPFIVDPNSGSTYGYIDRNFVTMIDGRPVFMGGFRSMLPVVSQEAQKGRFHGNAETVWAGIS